MSVKRIVLTGTSRGLGLAMTEGFVERGHTVIGCARSVEAVRELAARFPSPHRFDVVDVAEDGEVGTWATAVIERDGPPDLLINNAGLINANARLWEVPPEEFSELVDVNIKGVYHIIRHFVPAMLAAGRGVVVNFSSTWGRSTSPEVAPYCATKWAIEGLTRGLSQELPSGMAAVALNPGIIHTDMLESCFGSSASAYPSPHDWAQRAVPFILQIDGKDNGQPLTVPD